MTWLKLIGDSTSSDCQFPFNYNFTNSHPVTASHPVIPRSSNHIKPPSSTVTATKIAELGRSEVQKSFDFSSLLYWN
ncbi:hypothetical protein V6N13_082400 [Hibiscus sabdariffa]